MLNYSSPKSSIILENRNKSALDIERESDSFRDLSSNGNSPDIGFKSYKIINNNYNTIKSEAASRHNSVESSNSSLRSSIYSLNTPGDSRSQYSYLTKNSCS